MNQKVLKTLEYNKIITQLTSYAASTPGKLLCQNLLPMSDYHEIVQAQTETSDALTRVRMKGSLSLSGVRDVRDSLKPPGDWQRFRHSGAVIHQFPAYCGSPRQSIWPA